MHIFYHTQWGSILKHNYISKSNWQTSPQQAKRNLFNMFVSVCFVCDCATKGLHKQKIQQILETKAAKKPPVCHSSQIHVVGLLVCERNSRGFPCKYLYYEHTGTTYTL